MRHVVMLCCDCGETEKKSVQIMDKFFKQETRQYKYYVAEEIKELMNDVPADSSFGKYLATIKKIKDRYSYAFAYDDETYRFVYVNLLALADDNSGLMRIKDYANL